MPSLIGQTLCDRYRIDDHVGRGGMAEVYKVWDERRSAYLALKLLREDLAQDRIFLRRFNREAQTLAKLQHPNIVRFYGLEQDARMAFMLMDFVEGESLKSEIFDLNGRPMSNERILEVLRPVCSALHYAHEMGMVHCDTKPANIMIERTGRVLVTDFGIARMTDAATATMVGMGTPAYMAPELVRGQEPTPQTDIYALGVVLFEMLTGGERPFTGEQATITGTTSEKVRWEQMNLNPSSLKNWNPTITSDLEAVVLNCLAKDPARRYRSVTELLSEVEGALNRVGTGQPALRGGKQAMRPVVPEIVQRTPVSARSSSAERMVAPGARGIMREGGSQASSYSPSKAHHVHGVPPWIWVVVAVVVIMLGIVVLSDHSSPQAYLPEPTEPEFAALENYTSIPSGVVYAANHIEWSSIPEQWGRNLLENAPIISMSQYFEYLSEESIEYNRVSDSRALVDGDPYVGWTNYSGRFPHWIVFELSKEVVVNRIGFVNDCTGHRGLDGNNYSKDLEVYVASSESPSNFLKLGEFILQGGIGNPPPEYSKLQPYTFDPVKVKYVKVVFLSNNYIPSLYDEYPRLLDALGVALAEVVLFSDL